MSENYREDKDKEHYNILLMLLVIACCSLPIFPVILDKFNFFLMRLSMERASQEIEYYDFTPLALIGIAIDVSGSMQESFKNYDNRIESRFESFYNALKKSITKYKNYSLENEKQNSELLLFGYAFGTSYNSEQFQDLFSLLEAADNIVTPEAIEEAKQQQIEEKKRRYQFQIMAKNFLNPAMEVSRDLPGAKRVTSSIDDYEEKIITQEKKQIEEKLIRDFKSRLLDKVKVLDEKTLTLSELDKIWSKDREWFNHTDNLFFAKTPLLQCSKKILSRFKKEISKITSDTKKILLIVSDGASTDGDPSPVLEEIKSLGVIIICCYVTNSDVLKPNYLYSNPLSEWSDAAKLMFNAASNIQEDREYRELLEGRGWTIEKNAHLFTQVNHSETLEKFISLVLSGTQTNQ